MKKILHITLFGLILLLSACTQKPETSLDTTLLPDSAVKDENADYYQQLNAITPLIPSLPSSTATTAAHYQDYFISDITALDESQYPDYYLHKEDILDTSYDLSSMVNILHYISSQFEYVDSAMGDTQVTQGLNIVNTDDADNAVLYYGGNNWFYINVYINKSDVQLTNVILYIEYNDTSITKADSYYGYHNNQVPTSPSYDFEEIHYTEGDTSTLLHMSSGSDLIAYIELKPDDTATFYYFSGDNTQVTILDFVHETYFLAMDYNGYDYRDLTMYQNGIYMLEHRLMEKNGEYVTTNNFIDYNLKYVDGWDYYFNGSLYKDGTELPSSYNGYGPTIFVDYYQEVPTIRYEIDDAITQDYFTNPLQQYTFSKVSYTDFQTEWNRYADTITNNHIDANTLVYKGVEYNFTNDVYETWPHFVSNDFLQFVQTQFDDNGFTVLGE